MIYIHKYNDRVFSVSAISPGSLATVSYRAFSSKPYIGKKDNNVCELTSSIAGINIEYLISNDILV